MQQPMRNEKEIQLQKKLEDSVTQAVQRWGKESKTAWIQLKKYRKCLKDLFFLKAEEPVKSAAEQWLFDHFYTINREAQSAKKCLKSKEARKYGKVDFLFTVLESVLLREERALDQEVLDEIITQIQKNFYLTAEQFDFLNCVLRAACISVIYHALFATPDPQASAGQIALGVMDLSRIGELDFQLVIEKHCRTEKALLQDPAGIYGKMTVESREHYRHLAARIARSEKKEEEKVVLELVEKCRTQADLRRRHVGYFLTYHPQIRERSVRRGKCLLWSQAVLPAMLSLITACCCQNLWLFFLLWLPLWEICKPVLEHFLLRKWPVDFIPRLDPKKNDLSGETVTVAVSTLLPEAGEGEKLKKKLEQLYFCNRSDNVRFCLLADFKQSDYPETPTDRADANSAAKVIRELNREYGEKFFLVLRPRTFNRSQNAFIGWERKRGAITELVRLIRGEKVSLFSFEGNFQKLQETKYLIALDSDSKLLFDTAQTMLSAAVHPLNRPLIEGEGENAHVAEGYGILVPSVLSDLESEKATLFRQFMAGLGGTSSYDDRVHEVYQDLFFNAIFSGKGLIDVNAFYQVLDSRFPENQVLSHDVLEGIYLRTGYLSDVKLIDSFPPDPTGWLMRSHRWIRGDWQNIRFLCSVKNKSQGMDALGRYKLFDNLRRSLTPVFCTLSLFSALFMKPAAAWTVFGTVLSSLLFASVWSLLATLFSKGFFVLTRKYFSGLIPQLSRSFSQALFSVITLLQQTVISADAILRSLYRTFLSGRNMLEWTTAAQVSNRKNTVTQVLRYYGIAELLGILLTVFGKYLFLKILGVFFAFLLPFVFIVSRVRRPLRRDLGEEDREKMRSYCAKMWQYFEELANEENNALPPDNLQFAPTYRVANRTSPTNIGIYLLSILAARDFGFIDSTQMADRLERTVQTVEKLPKWQGNLYNWYDTRSLSVLSPKFVSTVDSGNFLCLLTALKEGILEYREEDRRLSFLSARMEKLIKEARLDVFYHAPSNLFSIGYDTESGKLSDSKYDYLMSEARMTSYFAIATRQAPKKHWSAMSRTMSRSGAYAGMVSWTGTMFEYFMPHLLLPVYDGSVLSETLKYCIYAQKKRVVRRNLPWGISESAYYGFDNCLNYQYKAHGIQRLGTKPGLDRELVLSPYSTFLTLPYVPISAMKNLQRFEEMGMVGRYGFYEAVDFTGERVGGADMAVIHSFMAHHIGMSFLSGCNALFDNIMQRRFLKDRQMNSAKELLKEEIPACPAIRSDYEERETVERRSDSETEGYGLLDPQSPQMTLFSNGELTELISDIGTGFLKSDDLQVTRHSTDLLRRPMGLYSFVKCGEEFFSVTKAPFYDPEITYYAENGLQKLSFTAVGKTIEARAECSVHASVSAGLRKITLKNLTRQRQKVNYLFYLEPVLASYESDLSHPAFSKLFLTARYDVQTRTLLFTRKNRDGEPALTLAVSVLEELPFEFETKRENLMESPDGLSCLKNFDQRVFSREMAVPDPCCAIRMERELSSLASESFTIAYAAAHSEREAVDQIIYLRNRGAKNQIEAAKSPLFSDSLECRLSALLLPVLLYGSDLPRETGKAISENNLGKDGLWALSVSGDLPIVLLEMGDQPDFRKLIAYLKVHRLLRAYQISFDLIVTFEDDGNRIWEALMELLENTNCKILFGIKGGIFLVNTKHISDGQNTLLHAAACYTVSKTMAQLGRPLLPFAPVPIYPVEKQLPIPAELLVYGGSFAHRRFYTDRKTPLPFSHILSNPVFGTIVSDSSPGHSFAVNARENKLTPWENDPLTDNTGEMLLVRVHGRVYNLTRGARTSFETGSAFYEGKLEKLCTSVQLRVSETEMEKYYDITLENQSAQAVTAECACYLEPVLNADRQSRRFIKMQFSGKEIFIQNPFNTAVKGTAVLSCDDENPIPVFDRAAFLSGRWKKSDTPYFPDRCAALIVRRELPPKRREKIRFVLSFAAEKAETQKQLKALAEESKIVRDEVMIHTPDPYLDAFFNHFLQNQILRGRLWGRSGFYQCGGAYGFRDQLQDVICLMPLNPQLAKNHILRCCSVQFMQGDVLHWWHALPENGGTLRGVRTRYSDDLLWLPFAVSEYVRKTGDESICHLLCSYVSGEPLGENEKERYFEPKYTEEKESVYRHCVRAIEHACQWGEYGLPLIGGGDWNDGFNRVGSQGKGMSVWLGMFLSLVLQRFSPVCERMGEKELADELLRRAEKLKENTDRYAWDGDWYLRAFYDDLSPMGSAKNRECKIDLLPQSFAVFCGMPDRERVEKALKSAWKLLVDEKSMLVHLFTPPFENLGKNPGYVGAYPPGIRENGGQYTHSAVWYAMALLEFGEKEKGCEILKMLNPAKRCAQPELARRYKLEPYYMAADIYDNPNADLRGGWSIYTGSASWYLRAVLETMLGFKIQNRTLTLSPKIPEDWNSFEVQAILLDTKLSVRVRRTGTESLKVDGKICTAVPLDQKPHKVEKTF